MIPSQLPERARDVSVEKGFSRRRRVMHRRAERRSTRLMLARRTCSRATRSTRFVSISQRENATLAARAASGPSAGYGEVTARDGFPLDSNRAPYRTRLVPTRRCPGGS